MESPKLTNWTQILTILSVLAGLGLVVWELQQARDLAFAQLAVDAHAIDVQEVVALLGESPAEVLAKSCESATLTKVELEILYASFQLNVLRASRLRWITAAGYGEFDWKGGAETNFMRIFDSNRGREWWRDDADRMLGGGTELVKFGNSVLNKLGPTACY
jgi:hypothetical protein